MIGMGTKRYEYHVYKNGLYVGNFKNVISEFNYLQTTNTIGSQLNIELGVPFIEVGAEVESEALVNEDSEEIIDENLETIVVTREYVFENVPIKLGNRVKVVEFSELYPSGLTVFDGQIVNWKANITNNTISLTVFSYGYELGQLVITSENTLNLEQEDSNGTKTIGNETDDLFAPYDAVAQVFTLVGNTNIAALKIRVNCTNFDNSPTTQFYIYLSEGSPNDPGDFYAFGARGVLEEEAGVQELTFNLFQFGTLPPGTYHFLVRCSRNPCEIYYTNTNPYTGGNLWTGEITNANPSALVEQTGEDLEFTLFNSSGDITLTLSNTDPGNVVRTVLDTSRSLGSQITYDSTTVQDTGEIMDYTFNVETARNIIRKAHRLSPSVFYYIDVGTNIFYFKKPSDSPDHILELGYDIKDLTVQQVLDELSNTIYFSGGDTGAGENLLVRGQSLSSIEKYGPRTKFLSDNRVTSEATANKYIDAELGINSEPKYRVQCRVLSDRYDTSTINIGDIIKIGNSNTLMNELELIVAEKEVFPYEVLLTLGSVEPRTTYTIDKLNDDLDSIEKQSNPNTLS